MRVVAGHAGLERVVQALDNLREAGRSRGQIAVTVEAGGPARARDHRPLGLKILGVGCRRAMTHLAGEHPVIGGAQSLPFDVVTLEAQLRASVADRLLERDRDRIRPIVAELAK